MSVPTNNPVAFTYTDPNATNTGSTKDSVPHPPAISKAEYVIAGIKASVYGLAELSASTTDVAVLWLLHPRLQTQECMAPFAAHFITSWNKYTSTASNKKKGLIAVSFDQRNHGVREVSAVVNEAWRSGNENHAQDMFSCYHGSATDTSLLLDYLEAYIFPERERQVVQNTVLGISLGGHASWHCLMHDPRISSAIIIIGCPDYQRLMSDRARLSKRQTWLDTKGRDFIGSKDFPSALAEAVRKYDPAGLVFGMLDGYKSVQGHYVEELSDGEKAKLIPTMSRIFGNKRILNLSGGNDKLVPYTMGKPFLDWLKRSCGEGGFFEGSGLHLEDIVVPGYGHEVPPEMVKHAERFLIETLDNETEMTVGKRGRRDSRI